MRSQALPEKRTIRVVAACVRKSGLILVTRRLDTSDFGGCWEFPGGKVEPGESDRQALVRELVEEMSFFVEPVDECYSKMFEYEQFILDFHLYNCLAGDQEILLQGIQDFAWVRPDELSDYRFPPADTEVVELISGGFLRESVELRGQRT